MTINAEMILGNYFILGIGFIIFLLVMPAILTLAIKYYTNQPRSKLKKKSEFIYIYITSQLLLIGVIISIFSIFMLVFGNTLDIIPDYIISAITIFALAVAVMAFSADMISDFRSRKEMEEIKDLILNNQKE